ncbi:MAG: hypothetical protein R3B70_25360 [Polyangiaceae bacterium]
MWTIDRIALEDRPEEPVLPCEAAPRKTHLCVRAVCCTSHEGMVGVEVLLGSVEAAGGADRTFQVGATTYGVIETRTTNDKGWAGFKGASDHKDSTLAVHIPVADYYSANEHAAVVRPLPGRAITLVDTHHTVVQAVVRSQVPLIPPDFDDTVGAMVGQMTRVRLLVDHGPNLGNQSAALALLQNLRRAGFDGPIDALVDTHMMIEPWNLTLTFTMPVRESELPEEPARYDAIARKLAELYPEVPLTLWNESAGFRRVRFQSEERVFVAAEREDIRLARHFRDLPFAYTLSEKDSGLPLDECTGHTPPPPMTDVASELTYRVVFSIQTAGEESLHLKLRRLDPAYETGYPGVTWAQQDGDGALPEFESDVSGDPTIVGMCAGGEAGESSIETYRKDKTKTHSFVAVQPLLWHPENRYYKLLGKPPVSLCLPEAAAYFVDPLVPPNKKAVLTDQLGPERGDALWAVMQAVGACDLMVAYGVHQSRSSSPAIVLDNLARALAKAIAEGALKKTLLLVICKPEVELVLAHEKVTRAALDASLAEKIGALGADRILFIHAPPIPQRSFQLVTQESTLPFLLEGANTCNQMQMLGKPYLSVCSETTPYVQVPGKDGHARLQTLTGRLNESGAEREERVQALAEYFAAAKDAAGVLDGYFPALRDHVKRKPLDQVKWALYRLKKALDDAPVPSSEQCRPTD